MHQAVLVCWRLCRLAPFPRWCSRSRLPICRGLLCSTPHLYHNLFVSSPSSISSMQLPSVFDTSDSDTDTGEVELYRPPASTRASLTADIEHLLAAEQLDDSIHAEYGPPDSTQPSLADLHSYIPACSNSSATSDADQQHPPLLSTASASTSTAAASNALEQSESRISDDLSSGDIREDKIVSSAESGSCCNSAAATTTQHTSDPVQHAAAAAHAAELSVVPAPTLEKPVLLNQAGMLDDLELDDLLRRLSANSSRPAAKPPTQAADQQDVQEQPSLDDTAAVTAEDQLDMQITTAYQPRWARQAGAMRPAAAAPPCISTDSRTSSTSTSMPRQSIAAIRKESYHEPFSSSNRVVESSSTNSVINSSRNVSRRVWSNRSLVTVDLRSDLQSKPGTTVKPNGINDPARMAATIPSTNRVSLVIDVIDESDSDSSEDDWLQFRQQHQRSTLRT